MAPTPACFCSQRTQETANRLSRACTLLQNFSKYLLAQNISVERLNGQDKVQPRIKVSPTEFLPSEMLAEGIAGVDGELNVVKLDILSVFS